MAEKHADDGPKSILVADDHPLYREAVSIQVRRLYPDADVLEAGSMDEALAMADRCGMPIDLFLMDYFMPGMTLKAITELAARYPAAHVALMSGVANPGDIRAAIEAGARGFVPKTASAEHFARAIQLLLSGGTSVPVDILFPRPSANGTDEDKNVPWIARLTPRERDVLARTAKGLSNKEIGRELDLAEVTIKLHLRSIFRKIGARSRAEAAVLASKAGIV